MPPGIDRYPYGNPDQGIEQGTSQITIVDASGNIASYTSSVETIFGSRHLIGGMVMNNQLTISPSSPTLAANQSPTADCPDGGRSIPHLLSRVPLASLVWNEPPARAVGLPHLSRRGITLVLERDPPLPWPFPLQQLTSDASPRHQNIGSGHRFDSKNRCWLAGGR